MARCSSVDPLERFRFKVVFLSTGDGEEASSVQAGFHDIQMPKRTTNKIAYREGTDPDISSQSAGLSTMEDIVLNRGLLSAGDDLDAINGLYKWMSAVHKPSDPSAAFNRTADRGLVAETTGAECYRKTVTIHLLDREGQTARKWKLYNAFPVNFVPGSDLSAAEDGEKVLESLTLAYEDFVEMDDGTAASTSDSVSSDPIE